jgi:hypothetical protein
MSPRLTLVVAFLVLAAGSLTGCTHEYCDCSQAGAYIVQMPPSPISSLTADAPCLVSQFPVDGGVNIVIGVSAGAPGDSGSCDVHETLADGTILVATLAWTRVRSGCCAGGTENVGPDPVFTLVHPTTT